MIKLNRFAFSTIALISGAPRHDAYVASIANTIQKVSSEQNTFVGVIGSPYESALSKVYANSNLLDNDEFEVTRAYNTYHEVVQDSPVIPYRTKTHLKNHNLVQNLEKNNFFEDVFNNKFSAVVTVGNFSLSYRISEKLNAVTLFLHSIAKIMAKVDHILHSFTDKSQRGQSITKSSWIFSTTTSKKEDIMLQAMFSLLFVSDMKGFTEPSSTFNSTKPIPQMTLLPLKTSPMSTFLLNQRE